MKNQSFATIGHSGLVYTFPRMRHLFTCAVSSEVLDVGRLLLTQMCSTQHLPGDASQVLRYSPPDQGLHLAALGHTASVPLDQYLVPGAPQIFLGA